MVLETDLLLPSAPTWKLGIAMDKEQQYRQTAAKGKYHRLYTHLRRLPTQEWKTTFSEVESIIGFPLPPSARLHRTWWSNQTAPNNRCPAHAWDAAGWETAEVDIDAETLHLRRKPAPAAHSKSLAEILPVHSAGGWPKNLSLRREDLY